MRFKNFVFVVGLMNLAIAGCGQENKDPEPQGKGKSQQPAKCSNPIQLERADLTRLRNLNEWLDGNAYGPDFDWQHGVRESYEPIQANFYAIDTKTGYSFYTEAIITLYPSKVPTVKCSYVPEDGPPEDRAHLAADSPRFPNYVDRTRGDYYRLLSVFSNVSKDNSSSVLFQHESTQGKVTADVNSKDFRFPRPDTYTSKIRLYRQSPTRFEMVIFERDVKDVEKFLSVVYELKKE